MKERLKRVICDTGSRPLKVLAGGIALTTAVLSVLTWYAWSTHREVTHQVTEELRLEELRGIILHLDEVLTMSTRMAAHTGDAVWEERYRRFEPMLDSAIKEALKLAPEADQIEAAAQTDAANIALVEMENQAFRLVRQGRREAAAQLLSSPRYQEQKAIYASGMDKLRAGMEDHVQTQVNHFRQRLPKVALLGVVAVASLLLGWVVVVLAVRKHLRGRSRAQEALENARRTLELRVKERTSELEAIIEDSPTGILVVDAETRKVVRVNRHARQIAGVTSEAVIGQPCYRSICTARRNACPILDLGQQFDTSTHCVRTSSGRIVPVLKSVVPITIGGRKHLLETFADMTDQKRVEDALREGEEKFRTISASAQDAIVMMDGDGNISFWNDAAQSIFGYTQQDVIGKQLHTLLAPERFHEGCSRAFPRFQVTGQGDAVGKTLELAAVRNNGEEFPIELSLSAVQISGQWQAIGIVRDITTRKQAEAERIRTLELEQERNHLRDAVKAFEQVLGVIGHELRTPLAGIRAMAEFLLHEETRESQEFDTFLGSINDEVVRMADMVNDLVEVARLHSGAARWNWSVVRVAEACEAAMDTVQLLVDHAQVQLALEVEPPDLTMSGDADAVRRLVLNLLSNACKNTAEGSISVRAGKVHTDNQDWVQLEVSDTGKGMPPDIVDRLGVAFALNSGMVGASHIKGSGLGLAISKGIVAAHAGTISVRTAAGSGTTVTVLLRRDLTEPVSGNEGNEILCEVL